MVHTLESTAPVAVEAKLEEALVATLVAVATATAASRPAVE